MFFYDLLPYWFVVLADLLARRPEAYSLYQFVQASLCFSVMFVPTVCLGMTLPLVSRIATAELARTGRSVGAVFSVNTVGTVFGTVITGLLLMPWLGMARTLALGIALNAGVGLIVLGRNRRSFVKSFAITGPIGACALVLIAGELFNDSWQRTFTMGMWRATAPPNLDVYRQAADRLRLKFYRDGAGSTVSVNAANLNGRDEYVLRVNGKPEASTTTDVPTQLLVGHVPALLHPAPRRVLVVGLGSGMTCGAVLRHPEVEQLDVVEISPHVAEAARVFADHNDKVLDNARFRLVLDDAKTFLQTTRQKYDVIISEPSNPWMAGVAGVFSREYYELCRARLQTNGVMAQWVQTYETDDFVVETVLRSFSTSFPLFSIWEPGFGDIVLVGFNKPPVVDFTELRRRFDQPAIKSDFERMDIFRFPVFLAREIVSPQNAPFVARPNAPVHSDIYPVLEFAAQRAFFVRADSGFSQNFDESLTTRPTTILSRYLQDNALTESDYKAFELLASLGGSISAEEREAERLGQVRDQLMSNAEKDPAPLRQYGNLLLRAYRLNCSVYHRPPANELKAVLERLVEVDPLNARIHRLHLAELAWDEGDDPTCFQLALAGLNPDVTVAGEIRFDLDPSAPTRMLARMIDTLWRSGKSAEALEMARQTVANGYAARSDGQGDAILEMVIRKVQTMGGPPPTAPAQGR
jgi:spermidine synthase